MRPYHAPDAELVDGLVRSEQRGTRGGEVGGGSRAGRVGELMGGGGDVEAESDRAGVVALLAPHRRGDRESRGRANDLHTLMTGIAHRT